MDDRIVELIKSRRDEGLLLLRKHYSGLIRYIVGGVLQDKMDTDECVSDIYTKVWYSIEGYRSDRGRFATWLSVVSRNAALNYVKRKAEVHDALTQDVESTLSVEGEVLRRQQAEDLERALSRLSSEERHIFYRKYYYLQPTAQIAAEMGTTERAIEGKLYRLRHKLRKELVGDLG